MRLAALALIGLGLAAPASAAECNDVTYDGNRFTVCELRPAQEELRLFLYDDRGRPYGQFDAVDEALAQSGETLAFAMNGGMYHEDRAPVGYYVENNVEQMRIVPNAGPGNFGLLPNGIFCIRDSRADVIETLSFVENPVSCRYATQSGPMLVIDGALHPRFLADSTSRFLRNGVGTSSDGTRAVFAISRGAVTFHEFGSFFRDGLQLPNALYLDGNISRLHAPDIGRSDPGFRMGPIIGAVTARPD